MLFLGTCVYINIWQISQRRRHFSYDDRHYHTMALRIKILVPQASYNFSLVGCLRGLDEKWTHPPDRSNDEVTTKNVSFIPRFRQVVFEKSTFFLTIPLDYIFWYDVSKVLFICHTLPHSSETPQIREYPLYRNHTLHSEHNPFACHRIWNKNHHPTDDFVYGHAMKTFLSK